MTGWARRQSFQRRLTALVAVAVGIAVAVVASVSYFSVSQHLYGQVDQVLINYDRQITQSAEAFGNGGRVPPGVIRASQQNGNIVEVVPRAGSPVSLAALFGEGTSTTFAPSGSERSVASEPNGTYRLDDVSSGGVEYRVLALSVSLGSASSNGFTPSAILIATPLTSTLNTLDRLRLVLYVVALAGIAVAVMLGLAISRVTIRPVKRLTAAAEHVAATQELDARIDDGGTDELGRLAQAFNAMLAALGASRSQQAQLVSDAGHELRTPLTSLRTNVELMMRAGQLPEADQRELYGDISAQIEELTTLIGDLVELARQDEQQPEPVEVRLDSIVEHALQRAQRRAPALRFDVALTPGSIRAQPPLLERAVLNVLDNAAKWSPAGAAVEVRLARGDSWVLEVRDHGPGIAPEDRPKVFDRFYRAPTARAMPGSGLGLAIVRQVVEAHGGHVTLDETPGGGTTVRIELPIVVEQEPGRPDLPLPPPPPAPVWTPPVPGPAPARAQPEDGGPAGGDSPAGGDGGRPHPPGVPVRSGGDQS